MTPLTKKAIQAAFKAEGYSVGFRKGFTEDYVYLSFRGKGMAAPCLVQSNTSYNAAFYTDHLKAFTLAVSLRGQRMEDTGQKIL